jgi:hypothetical protein
VIVGNQVFGSAAAPVKIEEFTKLAKQVEGIFPTEDEERDLKKSLEATLGRKSTTAEFDVVLIANGFSTRTKALKITVAVPTQLLSDTGSVIVKYPFLDPEKFIAESDVEFQESFGATGIQILSSTDKTVQLLISGRKFERPEILINGAKYSVCAPAPPPCVSALKLLGKKLLLLELPFGLTGLSTIGSLIVSQEDKFVILPIDQKPLASLKPEFHQLPVINLGDSKTFIFKGANLGSIQEIRFEGNALRFQIKDDGATLLVDFTTDVTQFIGFKKLIYTLKDGKSDSLEIKIN